MEPEGSLPHSQQPATCSYPEQCGKNAECANVKSDHTYSNHWALDG
jgi:hypothetical protein